MPIQEKYGPGGYLYQGKPGQWYVPGTGTVRRMPGGFGMPITEGGWKPGHLVRPDVAGGERYNRLMQIAGQVSGTSPAGVPRGRTPQMPPLGVAQPSPQQPLQQPSFQPPRRQPVGLPPQQQLPPQLGSLGAMPQQPMPSSPVTQQPVTQQPLPPQHSYGFIPPPTTPWSLPSPLPQQQPFEPSQLGPLGVPSQQGQAPQIPFGAGFQQQFLPLLMQYLQRMY